ncbi:hypothetical protein SEPCBS119000_006806, partial [Sporothrix epigloea]
PVRGSSPMSEKMCISPQEAILSLPMRRTRCTSPFFLPMPRPFTCSTCTTLHQQRLRHLLSTSPACRPLSASTWPAKFLEVSHLFFLATSIYIIRGGDRRAPTTVMPIPLCRGWSVVTPRFWSILTSSLAKAARSIRAGWSTH